MEITKVKLKYEIELGLIKQGDCFLYEGTLFICGQPKDDPLNGTLVSITSLSDGRQITVNAVRLVIPVDASVSYSIKHGRN